MKKILAIAAVTIFVLGGLLVWGVVATYNFVEKTAQSAVVQQKVDGLQAKVQAVTNLSLLQCWEKAQSIFSNQLWLNFPIANTIESLKLACFQTPNNQWNEEPSVTKQDQYVVYRKDFPND